VLRKLKELVASGATVVGPKPKHASGLKDFPASDAEVAWLAGELWDSGKIVSDKGARDVLQAGGIPADFDSGGISLDFIHRRDGDAEIYFVANRETNAVAADCTFRVAGRVPELWDAVTGERRALDDYKLGDGRVTVPLEFAPCGSWFVVFRKWVPAGSKLASKVVNFPEFKPLAEITGSWSVAFDTKWGGPALAGFDSLVSWTERPESGIKFYSGTAIYTKTFELPNLKRETRNAKLYLDLGNVRELAKVKVNGKSCGITWCPPFRVDITDAAKPGRNKVEVEVVNFWPNRIIGDAGLPKEQQLTHTNIRKFNKDSKLTDAGLLGPVRVLQQADFERE
jgi:hypothetical protein